LKKLRRSLPFDTSILDVLKFNGNVPIEKVASLACLSLRQFERVSRERLGVSPKFFARLSRFSNAYRLRERQPQMSWTSIAHESGYFDQMHFIRDFKTFSGITPTLLEKTLSNTPLRLQADMRL
jgi:transcriptional regulator GlxA family with amidase domain